MKIAKLMNKLGWVCLGLTMILMVVLMIDVFLIQGNRTNDAEILSNSRTRYTLITLFVFFGLTFVFLIGSSTVRGIVNKRILVTGELAEAKIVSLRDTGERINDNPTLKFSLEVFPQNQKSFLAEAMMTVSIINLPSLQPGKFVYVKYLPGDETVAIAGLKNEQ